MCSQHGPGLRCSYVRNYTSVGFVERHGQRQACLPVSRGRNRLKHPHHVVVGQGAAFVFAPFNAGSFDFAHQRHVQYGTRNIARQVKRHGEFLDGLRRRIQHNHYGDFLLQGHGQELV